MKRGFYVESNHGFRSKKANSFSPGGIEPRQERRRAHASKEEGENENNQIFYKIR